jgi:eukaryotic-like serine/threonine-protein kinase
MIGKKIAHYLVSEKIGQGGMGVVYKARDTHLDRSVAIKVLPAESVADTERKRRFVQEAKAASALNHPNIITIHDISQSEGVDFIAMEYVEGQTLHTLIRSSQLTCEQAVDYAVQISSALAAAHAAGIVHRDLKPTNIMVTEKGLVKVLDFGLAKLTEKAEGGEATATQTMTPATEQGAIVGTVAYMSPEQAEGKPIDARSDVFSFGSALYEMVTGRRAFQGESTTSTLSAILRDTPMSLRKARADVPAALEKIVNRCLEKNRESRYASGAEVWQDLTAAQSQLAVKKVGFGQILRKPQFVIPAVIVLAALTMVIGWFWVRSSRIRWARNVALPEIARLANEQRGCAALGLMLKTKMYLQGDPELEQFRKNHTLRVSVRTDPEGADFYIRDYIDVADGAEWTHLGRTPLESVVVPSGSFVCKFTKPGFNDLEKMSSVLNVGGSQLLTTLTTIGTSPPGMIWVPSQRPSDIALIMTEPIRDLGLERYWLDRYEVTNKEFKEFVDRGAYENREYWKQPFIKEGRVIPWEEAMAVFRDATGRPGPATWEFGTYSQDRADYPVSGVSWYEAVAYAEFAGKSLPTVHHWSIAAGNGLNADILQLSNFTGKGPARVGSYRGLSPYGSYDMAGNVREWCWNSTGTERYILGGAWSEPSYKFLTAEICAPMDRSPINGFRCAKYSSALPQQLTDPSQFLIPDRRGDKPAGDAMFQVYRGIHQYTRAPLRQAIDTVEDKLPYWRLEKVSFQAGYGNERVAAYLYLPKNANPPYQGIVYFPGSNALNTKSSSNLGTKSFDFVIRSGRAVMFPIYKGTYERGGNDSGLSTFVNDHNVWRDISIDSFKDLGRSLDYLETRSDIDREKFAYYGLSWGAAEGPRMIALEPRLKAGVLMFGGCWPRGMPAEVDPLNFAPRARVPMLMVNGKYDTIFPLEGAQIPLFQFLGTPEKDKKHFLVDAGHGVLNEAIIREILAWLDRYLGPVHTR